MKDSTFGERFCSIPPCDKRTTQPSDDLEKEHKGTVEMRDMLC